MSPSIFPLLLVLSSFVASAQPAGTIRLSLKQEFGRAGFRECRLDVGIAGAGSTSMRCVYAGMPATELRHGRALSPEEVARLLMLARESDLLSGGHVGADGTARDGIFETVTVTESGGTVVLVTSGNSTFMNGSRRALLNLLHTLLDELKKGAKR